MNNSVRKNILKTSYEAQAGHIPSALSIVEILESLYRDIMDMKEDKFILSKGHGCLALYSIFYEMGFITKEELLSFGQYNSKLGGHPHFKKLEQIEASTGSLGHGLPIALGIALAKKIQSRPGKVYCLIGDGECNEGTTWESALLAEKLKLNNLVCIVDNNISQTRAIPTKNIATKFSSFGWETQTVNGHDRDLLKDVLKNTHDILPMCLVCNTIKGKGIREMEKNMFAWHHGPPNFEQYTRFMEELNESPIC